ncbi:MAG: DUF4337 domain-containing protein [Beijerinckiaceae bacterium]|nr:DUF4337 domain-containing protein [Beijerinckiaceae bacterium]MCZ8300673.1 DUF4337 domain-containing protein [Beijerinckiaceae bacterium]
MSHGAGHDSHEAGGGNKRIGLLIAIMALILSFSEIGNKQSENESMAKNIDASNLWAFYQAKTIRRTSVLTAAEEMNVTAALTADPAAKAALEAQVKRWRDTAARYESEPETGEGRKELMARAKESETRRDFTKQRAEIFEISSALLQIGIVLASTAIITGVMMLVWCAGGLSVIALILMGVAVWSPFLLPIGH